MKRTIATDEAPAAVGAYSQATTNGSLLFTAGQIPLTPDGELLDNQSIAKQTTQCLENIEAILAAEEASLADVLKVTVYLADIDLFDEFDSAYQEFFTTEPPARSAVEVGALPKDVEIEIEAIAQVEGSN